ncbi:hypothetical protein GCM10027093_08960 [Paraburkholderia jirisanensis]
MPLRKIYRPFEPAWIVDKLIADGGLALIRGPAGSGKSFAALELALAAATGQPWFGRQVQRVSKAYLWIAKPDTYFHRLDAQRTKHRVFPDSFCPLGGDLDLSDSPYLDDVVEMIKRDNAKQPLLIIDSMPEAWPHSAAPTVLAGCDKLLQETGCTVVLVDPSTETIEAPRVGTRMSSAADTIIELSGYGANDREWRVAKVREAADGERRSFRLRPVQITTPGSAWDAMSCVIDDLGQIAAAAVTDKLEKDDAERPD